LSQFQIAPMAHKKASKHHKESCLVHISLKQKIAHLKHFYYWSLKSYFTGQLIMTMLRSLTSDVRWSEHGFICRGNPHLTSRFYRVELGPIRLFFHTQTHIVQFSNNNQLISSIYSGWKYQHQYFSYKLSTKCIISNVLVSKHESMWRWFSPSGGFCRGSLISKSELVSSNSK
jgi:hypothetical protein